MELFPVYHVMFLRQRYNVIPMVSQNYMKYFKFIHLKINISPQPVGPTIMVNLLSLTFSMIRRLIDDGSAGFVIFVPCMMM